MDKAIIVWTEYIRYRLTLRGYNILTIEEILRYSPERYIDTVTNRMIVIGKHKKLLVMIPYEVKDDILTPITIHTTSRQQINSRIKSGRLDNE